MPFQRQILGGTHFGHIDQKRPAAEEFTVLEFEIAFKRENLIVDAVVNRHRKGLADGRVNVDFECLLNAAGIIGF